MTDAVTPGGVRNLPARNGAGGALGGQGWPGIIGAPGGTGSPYIILGGGQERPGGHPGPLCGAAITIGSNRLSVTFMTKPPSAICCLPPLSLGGRGVGGEGEEVSSHGKLSPT